ncbi:hypothetical protein [Psychroserpens sp. S379A]|uniref:hypothetical protein n=1 Tax=Psychroserpens sp. S379A TaxID=3415137 RepID=UPI003C7AEC8F
MSKKIICKHIECNTETHDYLGYCEYHYSGGVLGTGETYEQYQVIEQDFIDFIKVVPINDDEHLKVHSPVLRDIIIRCCVQIEVFFKEWAKFECSENKNIDLLKRYNEVNKKTNQIKGARNWNFRDYFFIKEKYLQTRPLHVRPMETDIDSFKSWIIESDLPEWWNIYNAIKHDGINSKKKANLNIALESLAALFTLHCSNRYSRNYLKEFSNANISNSSGKLRVRFGQISSPLDTKRYLFKDVYSHFGRGIEIETSKKSENRARGIGKRV